MKKEKTNMVIVLVIIMFIIVAVYFAKVPLLAPDAGKDPPPSCSCPEEDSWIPRQTNFSGKLIVEEKCEASSQLVCKQDTCTVGGRITGQWVTDVLPCKWG